jgi:hypothetical protein
MSSSSFSVEEQIQQLGELIYEMVMEMFPGDENEPVWGKLTGLIIDAHDISELKEIVSNKAKLVSKIEEANRFYREHVKFATIDEEKQQRMGIVLSSEKSSKRSTDDFTPAQQELFDHQVFFSGQTVFNRNGRKDTIAACDDMVAFAELKDLILRAIPDFPMPVLDFLEFVFSSNHVFHTRPQFQKPEFNKVRAFYIRLIVFFVSSIKYCLVHKVDFDMEKYMRSVVFVSGKAVFSGPFLRIWESDVLEPFHEVLSTLHDEVEASDTSRRRRYAQTAASGAMRKRKF